MRRIGVVTVARSDFGLYRPVLRRISAHPELDLCLIASGMHLSPEFGLTVEEIEEEGFEVAHKVDMLLSSDTPVAVAKSIGLGCIGLAQTYSEAGFDLLLLLGDRFEMFAAAIAAVPFALPIAHIHGGEATEGLIDEAIRHSITKMSHLHFVATAAYRDRVIRMGEETWRVVLCGAPSLDNLHDLELLSGADVEEIVGVHVGDRTALVTYHPVTLDTAHTESNFRALLRAIDKAEIDVIFTCPNADTGGRVVIELIDDFVKSRDRHRMATNLGTLRYFSLMRSVGLMVGNSSSGIIEAASFQLPVVNVGMRQQGRVRARNVIDVVEQEDAIVQGINKALDPDFRAALEGLENPYGTGTASAKIVEALADVVTGPELLVKRFADL